MFQRQEEPPKNFHIWALSLGSSQSPEVFRQWLLAASQTSLWFFFFFKVCLPNLYSLESLFSLLPIIIFSNTEQNLSSKCHNAWSLCILKYLITYLHVLALTVMCVKKSLRNHSSLLCKMEIFTSGEAAERIKWDHIAKELSAIHGVRYELRFVKYVYFLLFVIIVLQWKEFFCSVFCPHFVVLPKNSHLHLAHLYLIKTLRIK